jgi:hypothetical protein
MRTCECHAASVRRVRRAARTRGRSALWSFGRGTGTKSAKGFTAVFETAGEGRAVRFPLTPATAMEPASGAVRLATDGKLSVDVAGDASAWDCAQPIRTDPAPTQVSNG